MNRITFGALVACLFSCTLELAHGAVGRTAASFGTSATGAAQYSIPIFAPPGTAGMTPTLALTYSSTAGDGLAGAGFVIGGLSQITRCSRTVAQDGVAAAPKLTTADRFCLDGVQLRLVAGPYGVAGSTYATEIETITRIIAYGSAGDGPAFFFVERKDGSIYEYGSSADSRIESLALNGGQVLTPRAWALSRVRDRVGNAIDITYVEDTAYGAFRPSEVRWTSNLSQGLSPAYKIVFVYEAAARPDTLYGYRFGNQNSIGGQITETKRIDRIDVFYNTSTLVRRYELTYEPAGGAGARSRLQSIQECAVADASDCLPATTFSWINGSPSWNAEIGTGQAVLVQPMLMDINNDGRDDLVYSSTATAGTGQWLYMLANATDGYGAPVSTGQANYGFSQALPLDWDGDGYTDFLAPNASNQWTVFRANGNGFSAPVNTGISSATSTVDQWWTADIDGDGRGDLVHVLSTGAVVDIKARLSTGNGFGSELLLKQIGFSVGNTSLRPNTFGGLGTRMRSSSRTPDFDGDGREDFVMLLTTTGEPDPPNPTPVTNSLCVVASGSVGTACIDVAMGFMALPQAWLMGDATGDGLTDLFYIYNNTAYLMHSRGNWLGNVRTLALPGYAAGAARVADWDGDGRDDLIVPNSSTGVLWVARSTGAALSGLVSTGLSVGTGNFASIGDLNGDGLPDLLRQSPSGSAWAYSLHQGVPADMLDAASDGYGNSVNFDYASIARSNHTSSSGAVYPERDDQSARHVVSQYTASNGIGGTYTMSYWYYGARVQVSGRGFEGFSARRSIDSRNGQYAYDHYRQQFPATGMLEKSERYQSNNATLISRMQNLWLSHSYGTGFETRSLPYLSNSTLTRYEVGGAYNGALISTATTTNVVDAATGTVYDSTTVVTEAPSANGANAGQSYKQRTWHSALFSDAANWCIGQPSTTQQINSHTMYGGAALTRTTSTSWDGSRCLPTQVISQPGDAKWQVATALAYDGFGNLSSQAITGIGMPTRTTSIDWGTTGQFPARITNALSQVTTKGWHPALGVQTRETDPNGLAVTWAYDRFGRPLREHRPDGTATLWAYSDCSSIGCVNANNKTVVVATALDTIGVAIRNQYTYLDRFERPLLTRAQTLSGAYNRSEREYDAQGRVAREAAPCWWGSCTPATSFWTRYTYDSLDRLVQVSRPINDSSGVYTCAPNDPSPPCQHSSVHHEGLTTRLVDAEGKQTARVASAIGTLSRSMDSPGLSVTYDYDAFANLARVSDHAAGTTILQAYTYNINGARVASSDVDLGSWSYTPNALGEIVSQRDANGAVTTFAYDLLGRITARAFPNAGGVITSRYTWGISSAAKNIGKLEWQEIAGTGITTYRETYSYDSEGRLAQTQYAGGSTRYTVSLGYAVSTGLLESLTYPLSTDGYRFKLRYEYRYGQLRQVSQADTGTRYWLANANDARGTVIDETLGDPADAPQLLRTVSGYDQITGLLDSRQTGPGGGGASQNLTYEWNKVGNLTLRQDNTRALTERFYYDSAHRLDSSTLNGKANLDLGYDVRGNIVSKTGVGAYAYSPTRLHAVTSIGSGSVAVTYSYDANGNMTKRAGSTIAWFADNLPRALAVNTANPTSFQYTPYGQRWQQSNRVDGATEYTVYIGSLFEKVMAGEVSTFKHYIHANGKPVALYVRNTAGAMARYSVLQDHLGSTDALYNTNGSLRVKESFDAFGKRRGTNWSGTPSASDTATIASLTRRGFTNHEHLDSTNLIHMNGRIYDPNLARFISADPYVSDLTAPQAFNRYSYVQNNPLSLIDPSGFQASCADNNKNCPKADEPPGTSGRAPIDWRNGPRVSNSGVNCYGRCGAAGYFNGPFAVNYEWQRGSRSSIAPLDPANGDLRVNETPGRWVNTYGDSLNRALDELGKQIGVGLFICIFDSGLPGSCGRRQFAAQGAAYFANVIPVAKVGAASVEAVSTGSQLLYRYRRGYETATRLNRSAANAEANIGVHGVSVTTNPILDRACGVACREAVESVFPVVKTGSDPSHYTVVLPKPVSAEVADVFNQIFKDLP